MPTPDRSLLPHPTTQPQPVHHHPCPSLGLPSSALAGRRGHAGERRAVLLHQGHLHPGYRFRKPDEPMTSSDPATATAIAPRKERKAGALRLEIASPCHSLPLYPPLPEARHPARLDQTATPRPDALSAAPAIPVPRQYRHAMPSTSGNSGRTKHPNLKSPHIRLRPTPHDRNVQISLANP